MLNNKRQNFTTMTLDQLKPHQISMLKEHYLYLTEDERGGCTSWDELANADTLVTMEDLRTYFGSTEFVADDFGLIQEDDNDPQGAEDFSTIVLSPFIQMSDQEGATAYAEGYHSHGGKLPLCTTIYFDHPFAVWYDRGECTKMALPTPTDRVDSIMRQIRDLMTTAAQDGLLSGCHAVNDYYIEKLTITKDGNVVVGFGS